MKICFKCKTGKPLDDFYPHPRMADGHLNKCKECNKMDSADRISMKKLDPDWIEKEVERGRLKARRQRENGTATKLSPEVKKIVNARYSEKFPEKRKAHYIMGNAIRDGELTRKPCEVCGSLNSQGHHEDYSKPLDVIWYCPKHHAERHVEIRRLKRLERAKLNTFACV